MAGFRNLKSRGEMLGLKF